MGCAPDRRVAAGRLMAAVGVLAPALGGIAVAGTTGQHRQGRKLHGRLLPAVSTGSRAEHAGQDIEDALRGRGELAQVGRQLQRLECAARLARVARPTVDAGQHAAASTTSPRTSGGTSRPRSSSCVDDSSANSRTSTMLAASPSAR